MNRILYSSLAVLFLATASPALAGDCHGDCKNCPHHAAGAKADAAKDAPPCACSGGKECKCAKGCACDHCAHKKDDKKATSKT